MARRILTGDITGNKSLPLTKDSLDFLQDTYLEDAASAFRSQISNYQNNIVYRVYGFDITQTVSTIDFTSGVLFYNGQFFAVSAPLAPINIADTAVFKINTSFAAFDPTEFRPAGAGSFNVHQIQTIVIEDDVSGGGISDVSDLGGIIREFVQEIGSWNMSTTPNVVKTIPAEVQKGKIRGIEIIIQNDSIDTFYPINYFSTLNNLPSGYYFYNIVNDLRISRNSGSTFDSSDFSGTTNRGFITYSYEY